MLDVKPVIVGLEFHLCEDFGAMSCFTEPGASGFLDLSSVDDDD